MGRPLKAAWAWTWRLFRPFRLGVIGLCLGVTLRSLLMVGFAVLTRYVVDSGLAGAKDFRQWAAILLLVLVITVALGGGLSWLTGSVFDRSTARLRHDLLESIQASDAERLLNLHSGTILNRSMADVRSLCDSMTNTLPSLVGNVFRLIAVFAAFILLYPAMALVLALAGSVIGLGAALLRPELKRRQRDIRRADEQVFSGLQEDIQQNELLQAMGAEKESLRRFDILLDKSLSAKKRRRRLSVFGGAALSAIIQLGSGCLLIWGVYQVQAGVLSFGSLTALLQLLALFRGPVLGLSGLWTRLTAMEVSAERLRELLDLAESTAARSENGARPSQAAAVVFENVTFAYKEEEAPALDGLSVRLDLQNWTCLSGLSGRGKTTIFKLILGLYQPDSGRVYLETDQGRLDCGPATRHLFAYVPQDFALFSGSIRDNLLLARPDADKEACQKALSLAQADFVRDLPDGDKTEIREHNVGLSMGQMQRLAIARALLMERPVLLLDECTSALDAATEQAVFRELYRAGGSAIAVTHHPQALEALPGVAVLPLDTLI